MKTRKEYNERNSIKTSELIIHHLIKCFLVVCFILWMLHGAGL